MCRRIEGRSVVLPDAITHFVHTHHHEGVEPGPAAVLTEGFAIGRAENGVRVYLFHELFVTATYVERRDA